MAFFVCKPAFASVSVNAVQLVIEPRTRFAKVLSGYLAPRDNHQDVGQALFDCGIFFHSYIFLSPPRRVGFVNLSAYQPRLQIAVGKTKVIVGSRLGKIFDSF